MGIDKKKVVAVAPVEAKKEERDCFVDGCLRAEGECPGVPQSNRCAACRLKKNYLKV